MNSELQTGESKTHSTVVGDDWAADGKTEVLQQSYALKDNNNDTDVSRKMTPSQDDKKNSSKMPTLLFPKWHKYLGENDENCEDLLCVVRQFCLEKPVTMATNSYNHVKLC